MTIKDAIFQLENRTNIFYFTPEDNKAFDMAIEALKILDKIGDLNNERR